MTEHDKSTLDLHLKAYDLMETALDASSVCDAIANVRADLEVLDRDTLLRVALAVTVESTWRLTPVVDRPRLRDRLQRARVRVLWEGS
jgi:hypothetical protein